MGIVGLNLDYLVVGCSPHVLLDENKEAQGLAHERAGSDTCKSFRENIGGINCDTCPRSWDGLKCLIKAFM